MSGEEKEKKKTLAKYKNFNDIELTKEQKKEVEEFKEEKIMKLIKDLYPKIIKVLRKYCDLDERYYNIIALWILGTYLHKSFITYPYLFFNAMKGSGKTRLLRLISILSCKGDLLASLREAVLFRTASKSTLCIDEFEYIGSKEKENLRELLNAAYKQGIIVKRMHKAKRQLAFGKGSEEVQVVESFSVFCPIAMANIRGMESVLGDRCITMILEKSSKEDITRLLEIFNQDADVLEIKNAFPLPISDEWCSLCSVVTLKNIYIAWNNYIIRKLHLYTNITNNNNYINYTKFFESIEKTKLDGRHLELFFPLFIIADYIGEDILEETIETAKQISKSKKGEDLIENKDIALIDYISEQEETKEPIKIKDLTNKFREFLEEDQEEVKWTNTRWMGRALKRLNLIIDKRRLGKGFEVTLNYKKAQEKIKMFKEVDPEQKPLKKPKSEAQAHLEPPEKPKNARIFKFIRNCPEIQLTSGIMPAKLKGDVLDLAELGKDKEQALRALITQGYVGEE